jgi:type IV secretory pathway VirB10-like protein
MRLHEIKTIKPIQPTPSAARINALKQQKTRAKDALTAERDRQKKAKATERVQKAQQALAKARLT